VRLRFHIGNLLRRTQVYGPSRKNGSVGLPCIDVHIEASGHDLQPAVEVQVAKGRLRPNPPIDPVVPVSPILSVRPEYGRITAIGRYGKARTTRAAGLPDVNLSL
jgi:hypothetical protein